MCDRSYIFFWLTHWLVSINCSVAQSICRSQSCCKNKIKHLHSCLRAPRWTDLHSASFTVCSGMGLVGRSLTNSVWKLFRENWKYYCSHTGYSTDLCNSSVQLTSHGCQCHFNANVSTETTATIKAYRWPLNTESILWKDGPLLFLAKGQIYTESLHCMLGVEGKELLFYLKLVNSGEW